MTVTTTGKDSNIRARVSSTLKVEAEKVLLSKGFNLSEAIRIYFEAIVDRKNIPFEVVTEKKTSPAMLARIRRVKAKEKAMNSKYKGVLW